MRHKITLDRVSALVCLCVHAVYIFASSNRIVYFYCCVHFVTYFGRVKWICNFKNIDITYILIVHKIWFKNSTLKTLCQPFTCYKITIQLDICSSKLLKTFYFMLLVIFFLFVTSAALIVGFCSKYKLTLEFIAFKWDV